MLKIKVEFPAWLNQNGEPRRFHPLCVLFLHRWTNSSDKNHWGCWRCSRCNKLKYVLRNAGR